MSDPFAALARSAVLGAHTAPPELATGDPELDALLARRPVEPPERTLLRAAAALSTVARAASPPRAAPNAAAPAPPHTRPRCGPRATGDLRAILAGGNVRLLPEWLALANRYARRVPEELLPALLTQCARLPELRDDLRGAIDARGWWLAAQSPRWTYAIASDDDAALFELGTTAAVRAAALRRLRGSDPTAARSLLAGSWPTETPADRAPLLEALAAGLSIGDEPLLETARADKRAEVRRVATQLLHRLPESAAVARGVAIADPLVSLDRGGAGARLTLRPPEACTPEMLRDGVEAKPDRAGVGEHAWWLERSLARVPPAHWRERFAIGTGELLEAAREPEFGDAALRGFALAIERFRDAPGLADLLALATHDAGYLPALAVADHAGLDPAEREALVARALQAGAEGADVLLAGVREPWSLAFSRAALDHARRAMTERGDWDAFRRRGETLDALAERLDPATPNRRDGWPEFFANERMRVLVEATLDAVDARAGIAEHFADDE